MSKYVYFFGSGKAEGRADMKELLGGKGANLAEMTNIGLPVPAGFTLTTEVCTYYYAHDHTYPPELKLARSEEAVAIARRLGDPATLAYALAGYTQAHLSPDRYTAILPAAEECVRRR